jgi:probable rRNA maturation factor
MVEHGPHPGLSRREILRRIDAMIALLQLQDNEVSFVLTDNKSIHKLNKIYRNKDRPTDVLAFAMREGDFAELAGAALGDVIVSVEAARKQARERGASVLEEVTMLLAHGLLHLLGWDHETPAKDRRMRAETDRLCQAARPPDRSEAGKRLSARASMPPSPRSKPGADPALSLNRSALNRRGRRRKVATPQSAKARDTGKD